jgi:aspartate aminotransferase
MLLASAGARLGASLAPSSGVVNCAWAAMAQRAASRFAAVPEAPKDPILGVTEKFLADQNPAKMNLGVVRHLSAPVLRCRRGYSIFSA